MTTTGAILEHWEELYPVLSDRVPLTFGAMIYLIKTECVESSEGERITTIADIFRKRKVVNAFLSSTYRYGLEGLPEILITSDEKADAKVAVKLLTECTFWGLPKEYIIGKPFRDYLCNGLAKYRADVDAARKLRKKAKEEAKELEIETPPLPVGPPEPNGNVLRLKPNHKPKPAKHTPQNRPPRGDNTGKVKQVAVYIKRRSVGVLNTTQNRNIK